MLLRQKQGQRSPVEAISKEIAEVVSQLGKNRQTFDMVGDEDLLDALIFEQNALMARYRYLLRLAREQAVTDRGNQPCLTPSASVDF